MTDSLPDPHSDPQLDHWHDQEGQGRDTDVTQEFWGDGVGWSSQPVDAGSPRGGIGATVGRWRSSGAKGRRGGTRTHGVPTPAGPVVDDLPAADVGADDAGAADWDDSWDTAPAEPTRSGVDPLLARLGGLAVVLTLLVPVVMGFTSDDGDAVRTASAPIEAAAPLGGSESPATTGSEIVPTSPTPAPPATPSVVGVEPTMTATAASSTALPSAAAPTPADVEALVDECAVDYEVADGDFWIRIADGSGTSLNELLTLNDATTSTPLYPGRSICLPAGSTTPPPPTATPTTVAPTTKARTSSGSSSAATSTSASKTSTTPTPTAPAPPPPPASTASAAEVEAIIRSVWPDELEERALEIAWRESKYTATAKNNCCYGVFQVYWSVHRSWLADLGITSAEQLFDPTLNARAALRLYERAGGWGPWGG